MYRNEREVGEGIRQSGVPREEIFVTSKLWCTKHRNVEAAIRESLELLDIEYLDLYLVSHRLFWDASLLDASVPLSTDSRSTILPPLHSPLPRADPLAGTAQPTRQRSDVPKERGRESGYRACDSSRVAMQSKFADRAFSSPLTQDRDWSIAKTWEQMERVQEMGLTRAIGVSK